MGAAKSMVEERDKIHGAEVSANVDGTLKTRSRGGLYHVRREDIVRKVNGTVPSEKKKSSLSVKQINEIPLEDELEDELVAAWEHRLELSHEECKELVDKLLRAMFNTLKRHPNPFVLRLNDEYSIIVERESEEALRLTKALVTRT